MLELIVKGLILWVYDMILECVGFIGNLLLEVFSMDTSYFVSHVPVVLEMQKILIAVGWALLLGNLAFQAMRSMMAGIGLNAEDPKLLFAKSFLFAFLLFASPEICQVGMDLTSNVINLLQLPDTVSIMAPEESWFDFTAGWLLAVICGFIMLFQVFKLFFEIGERYVVLSILVFFAPVAFAMGGSRSTEDIFKGWVRMFGSMCVVMVSNVFFLKVILSALSTIPNTLTIIPWLIFVVGLCKVARRIDDILCRLGLNAAHTGREHIFPGAFTAMVLRSVANTVRQAAQTYAGQMPHFGDFRSYAPGGWRWGGTFSDLPERAPPGPRSGPPNHPKPAPRLHFRRPTGIRDCPGRPRPMAPHLNRLPAQLILQAVKCRMISLKKACMAAQPATEADGQHVRSPPERKPAPFMRKSRFLLHMAILIFLQKMMPLYRKKRLARQQHRHRVLHIPPACTSRVKKHLPKKASPSAKRDPRPVRRRDSPIRLLREGA